MPFTKDFRETVMARAAKDPAFKAGLYEDAVQTLLDGDLPTARVLLRDFINATIGFARLAEKLGINEKSLMRMFGPAGNPTAQNLLAVIQALKAECKLTLTVAAKADRRRPAAEIRAA